MFATLLRRTAVPPRPAFNIYTNPYKAKRPWPPDLSKLSKKHQFRLERRYRRRAKLKWARPGWTKATKIVQWGTGIFVLVYGVLFMDWGKDDRAFSSIRGWYKQMTDSIWTSNTGQHSQQPAFRTPPST